MKGFGMLDDYRSSYPLTMTVTRVKMKNKALKPIVI